MVKKQARCFIAILVLLLFVAGGLPAAAQRASSQKSPSASKKAAAKKTPARKSAKKKGRSSRSRGRAVARGPRAPSPERIRQIQAALASSGHYSRGPNGVMDAPTVAALTRFQQENGLQPTGKLNAGTLRKLEKYGLPASSRSAANTPLNPPAPAVNPQ